MYKLSISSILIAGIFTSYVSINDHSYSTTAVVTLVGAVIKSSQSDVEVAKYKRKDCPVCKGKGWYISGDKISKVDCGYCEPETQTEIQDAKPETRKYR